MADDVLQYAREYIDAYEMNNLATQLMLSRCTARAHGAEVAPPEPGETTHDETYLRFKGAERQLREIVSDAPGQIAEAARAWLSSSTNWGSYCVNEKLEPVDAYEEQRKKDQETAVKAHFDKFRHLKALVEGV